MQAPRAPLRAALTAVAVSLALSGAAPAPEAFAPRAQAEEEESFNVAYMSQYDKRKAQAARRKELLSKK